MMPAHNYGIRTDNRLCNLRWDTQNNNAADKKRHGTNQTGEKHGTHKLTADQVRGLRYEAASGIHRFQLASKYQISFSYDWAIIRGRTWKAL
jgi:hypothetical protein